jgi:multidrug efflux system membrane fusion protein
LQLDTQHDALTVPAPALLRGPVGSYVFVVNPAHVIEKRAVTTGYANRDLVVVDSGLQPGEQVVTDGQYRVQAGTHVTTSPQADQGTAAQGTD